MPEDNSRETISTILKGANDYENKLNKIRDHVRKKWIGNRHVPEYYTLHDDSHCEGVENGIYKLIPKDKVNYFNAKELFCLISAAWLHDIGMIPDPDMHIKPNSGIYDIVNPILSEKYPNYRELLQEGNAEIYRLVHHLLSQKYIEKNFKDLGLDPVEAGIIGILSRYHRKSENINNVSTPTSGVDVKRLAAYLRLADAIHVNRKRIDEDLLMLFQRIGMPDLSMLHWLKNLCVSEVVADNKDLTITVEIMSSDSGPKDIEVIADFVRDDIKSELLTVKDILAKGGVSFYLDVRTSIITGVYDLNKTILLNQMISKIQISGKASASDVIDSMMKNISSILMLPNDQNRDKYRMIRWHLEHVIGEILIDRPCHALVKHIYAIINKYAAEDPEKIKEDEISEKLNLLKNELDSFTRNRDARKEKLFKYTNAILADCGSILLFGNSTLVLKALSGVEQPIKDETEIYVCEGRNIGYYNSINELVYGDGIEYAASIVKKGYKKVFLLPDILSANLMSRGKIDKVIFGANGVDIIEGTFGHSGGHLAIADLACSYDIPVYVILDSYKFGEVDRCYNPDHTRKSLWLSGDEKIQKKLVGVQLLNPREDVIRNEGRTSGDGRISKRLTALITDYGIIQANEIPNVIIDHLSKYEHISNYIDSKKREKEMLRKLRAHYLNSDSLEDMRSIDSIPDHCCRSHPSS